MSIGKAKRGFSLPCVIFGNMEIEYSSHFQRAYQSLDVQIRKKAEKRESVFRKNPFGAVLKTHKLQGKLREFYSFSIDNKFRIVFKLVDRSKAVFLDVGDHDMYR